jgi:hypothetical protein
MIRGVFKGCKIIRANNPGFKITNNNFKTVKGLSLRFWGGEILPFF